MAKGADVRTLVPWNLDVESRDDGTFVLKFEGGGGDGPRKEFRIICLDWWVPHIVDGLRGHAKKRAEAAQKLLKCFTEG